MGAAGFSDQVAAGFAALGADLPPPWLSDEDAEELRQSFARSPRAFFAAA